VWKRNKFKSNNKTIGECIIQLIVEQWKNIMNKVNERESIGLTNVVVCGWGRKLDRWWKWQ